MQKYWNNIKSFFQNNDEEKCVPNEYLDRRDKGAVDKYFQGPSYAYLTDELDDNIGDWLKNNNYNNHHIKLIILPPGDDDFIIKWATEKKLTLLDEPSRESLFSGKVEGEIIFPKSETIVIPRLERWFLRHKNGLNHLRLLLSQIESSHKKIIIGCNSWAWQFIIKSVNADFILPEGITFHPYDEMRLYYWFRSMHDDIKNEKVLLRISRNGCNIFELNKDGELKHHFIKELAAESFGIPWVARSLLKCSVKIQNKDEIEDKTITDKDKKTLWITELEQFILPEKDKEKALLILHALLIHSSLTRKELYAVLPVINQTNIMPALIQANIVINKGNFFNCNPIAYPTIRKALSSAAFPLDQL